MSLDVQFLESVAATNFADLYYSLCREHPLRLEMPPCDSPAREVLQTAKSIGIATQLAGPGRPFRFEVPSNPPSSPLKKPQG
jgi:hypothetical protein